MSDVGNDLALALLGHVLRNVTWTPPASPFLSLHTADPGKTGASEAAGGSYSRKSSTWGAPFLDPADSNRPVSLLAGTVLFINMPAGDFPYAGLWNQSSGGVFITKILLTPSLTGVLAGQAVAFGVGDLKVRFP